MKEIAAKGDIEAEALMKYVVDGITDDLNHKLILSGASTLNLKKNFDHMTIHRRRRGSEACCQTLRRILRLRRLDLQDQQERSRKPKTKRGLRCQINQIVCVVLIVAKVVTNPKIVNLSR